LGLAHEQYAKKHLGFAREAACKQALELARGAACKKSKGTHFITGLALSCQ
jgi:hypothetical protein